MDETHFRYWMRQSAENGFPDAQFYVGMLLADTRQNALYWLKKAATSGHETAMINVPRRIMTLDNMTKQFNGVTSIWPPILICLS